MPLPANDSINTAELRGQVDLVTSPPSKNAVRLNKI